MFRKTDSAARLTFALIAVHIVANAFALCAVILNFFVDIKMCKAVDDCDIDTIIAWKSTQYAAWALPVAYPFRYIIDPIITFIVDRRLRNCVSEIFGFVIKC